MPQRPQIFDRKAFERSLRDQGCPESLIAPNASDFKLFVPVVLRYLGEDELVRIMNRARPELGLGEQDTFWHQAAKYFVGWAEEEIEAYKMRREKQAGVDHHLPHL